MTTSSLDMLKVGVSTRHESCMVMLSYAMFKVCTVEDGNVCKMKGRSLCSGRGSQAKYNVAFVHGTHDVKVYCVCS